MEAFAGPSPPGAFANTTRLRPLRRKWIMPVRLHHHLSLVSWIMGRSLAWSLLVFSFFFCAASSWASPQPAKTELAGPPDEKLADEVYALLRTRCFSCHGAEQQESGLRLDSRERFLLGGDHGGLQPNAASSQSALLMQVVKGEHADLDRMPPAGEGTPLDADEIERLLKWLKAGAPYPADLQTEDTRPRSLGFPAHPAAQGPRAQGTLVAPAD